MPETLYQLPVYRKWQHFLIQQIIIIFFAHLKLSAGANELSQILLSI